MGPIWPIWLMSPISPISPIVIPVKQRAKKANAMKRLVVLTITLILMAGTCIAQNVIAEPDIDGEAVAVLNDPAAKASFEKECITKVVSEETAYAEFYRAARILAIIGSDACVEPLAALLGHPEKAHLVRNVLEKLPSEKAGEALRAALATTTGAQRIGVISSLGVKKDQQATAPLAALLNDPDSETVSCAANALGAIASSDAIKALTVLLEKGSADTKLSAAKALLRAASHLQGEPAAIILNQILATDMPDMIRAGAFSGLLDAEPQKALDRIISTVEGQDELLQLTAIAALATLNAPDIAKRLAPFMPKLAGNLQALVVAALTERSEASVLPLLHAVLDSDSEDARLTAMRAIAVHGDVSSVEPLCAIIEKTENRQERMASVETLRRLPGDDVNNALIQRMTTAPESVRGDLMDVLAQRNVVEAVNAIIDQIQYDAMRPAAFRALTHIVEPERLPEMLALLAALKDDNGRPEAESTVAALCTRIAAKDGQQDKVAAVLENRLEQSASNPEKVSLLRILGRLGGEACYKLVISHLESEDAVILDGAVRALANWPDTQAVDKLAAIFTETQDSSHRMLALRGCVRLLRLGKLEPTTALAVYGKLVEAATNGDERKQILAGLADMNSPDAIPLVLALLEDDSVKSEANMALKRIGDAAGLTEADIQKAKEASSADPGNGFEAIFDGKTLNGWVGEPSLWRVEDGCIVGESTKDNPVKVNTFLTWEGPADNFELKFRYKIESEWANSGMQIRSERFDGYRVRGYQADISNEDWITGICYEEGGRGILARRGQKLVLGDGEDKQVTQFADENELGKQIKMNDWNEYHIVAKGNQFVSTINGYKMHEVVDNSSIAKSSGVLAIQLHAGPPMKIRVTDIMLKRLPRE